MLHRIRSTTRMLAIALGALLLPAAAPAGDEPDVPPSPEQIAAVCIERVATQTQAAGQLIAGNTTTGVSRIAFFDANDAPVPVLVGVARNTAAQSRFIGGSTLSTVNQITVRCVVRLQALDADPALIEQIVGARQASRDAIAGAVGTSLTTIKSALGEALADEDLPGDG